MASSALGRVTELTTLPPPHPRHSPSEQQIERLNYCRPPGAKDRSQCQMLSLSLECQSLLFTWLLFALLTFSCAVGNSHLAAPFLSWLLRTCLCPLDWDGLYLVPTGCRPESPPCATAGPLAHRSTSESVIGPLSLGNEWLICGSCLTPHRP